ncbi:MAG TPA: universal stress protein [Burkholderiaceae bacterium]
MYKRILVAVDTSSTARKALDEAIALAGILGAQLCVLHVADEASLVQHGMGLGSYLDVDRARTEIRSFGSQLLAEAVARAGAAGCQAEQRLIESTRPRVAPVIDEAAREWKADLVVVGAHGRRGFERMLVGSVAEHLTRIASTSLLIIREQ